VTEVEDVRTKVRGDGGMKLRYREMRAVEFFVSLIFPKGHCTY
jgi:hypothetical protein